MPKIVKYTDWAAKARLATIRRQNVDRHASYESQQVLSDKIRRHQINHTHQMEHDRLLAATVQGNLRPAAEARLRHLKNILVK